MLVLSIPLVTLKLRSLFLLLFFSNFKKLLTKTNQNE